MSSETAGRLFTAMVNVVLRISNGFFEFGFSFVYNVTIASHTPNDFETVTKRLYAFVGNWRDEHTVTHTPTWSLFCSSRLVSRLCH